MPQVWDISPIGKLSKLINVGIMVMYDTGYEPACLAHMPAAGVRGSDGKLRVMDGYQESTQKARFTGPTWGPSGADRTQVDPMLAP